MKFRQSDPVKIYLDDYSEEEYSYLFSKLTYTDKSVDHQIRQLKNNPWYIKSMGEQAFTQKLEELKAEQKKQVLYQDSGGVYTLSGLKSFLSQLFPKADWASNYTVPEVKLLRFEKIPKLTLREYQEKSIVRLLEARHGNTELATGAGKTAVLLYLAKETGLKTVVAAPSTDIATTIYRLFVDHFGKSKVGKFMGTKKETGKLITVATAQSLTRIEPGTEHYDNLSKAECFMFDECHLVAAQTFFKIATGICANAPYRYFCSATPERNDGKDLLMKGIIGDAVCRKTIKDLIEEGYLARISTTIMDVESDDTYSNLNAMRMNQHHLYTNMKIVKFISDISEQALRSNIPTLILIDEHDQEALLKANMRVTYEYASGGTDTHKIVEDFNAGRIMCVVGTSAVSIGSDFKSNRLTIAWQGGRSGTKVKQGPIGRSTRLDPRTGKTECRIIDFRISNVPMQKKHANSRIGYYEEVGPVTYGKL